VYTPVYTLGVKGVHPCIYPGMGGIYHCYTRVWETYTTVIHPGIYHPGSMVGV